MDTITLICILFTTAAMWVHVFFEYRQAQHPNLWALGISKTVASIGFVATALTAGLFEAMPERLIFIGLLLCLAGDILLVPKQKAFFAGGILFFLGGQLLYCFYFLHGSLSPMGLAIGGGIMALIDIVVLRWLWPYLKNQFKVVVPIYIVAISLMAVTAIGGAFAGTNLGYATAAILFVTSDIWVAKDKFVKAAFYNRAIGLPLYYAAQLLFATSAVFWG